MIELYPTRSRLSSYNVPYPVRANTFWSTFFANCRKTASYRYAMLRLAYQRYFVSGYRRNKMEKRGGRCNKVFVPLCVFFYPAYITLEPNVSRRLPVRIRISRWKDFTEVFWTRKRRASAEGFLNVFARLICIYRYFSFVLIIIVPPLIYSTERA